MSHVFWFSDNLRYDEAQLQSYIQSSLDDLKAQNDWYVKDAYGDPDYEQLYKKTFGHTFEVVLAGTQVLGETGQNRVNMLIRNGFRLVNRFLNDNSGNECFVFHRTNKRRPLSGKTLPFSLKGEK